MTAKNGSDRTPWSWPIAFLDSPLGLLLVVGALSAAWALSLCQWGGDKTDHALTGLAVLLGGVWVVYQFALRRGFESALAIDVSVSVSPHGNGTFLTSIDVTLQNTGNRRITAPAALSEKQQDDYERSVKYPCDLQLRAVPRGAAGFVGWWSSANAPETVQGVPEHVALLFEYTRKDRSLDFFMEPGERYIASATFVLPEGSYMAKIVFVGARATASEFWSRVVAIRVSAPPEPVESRELHGGSTPVPGLKGMS